jgi:hypothetical protein
MKPVKNFAPAVLLALVLAVSSPAGEVPMPGAASPTPTPTPVGLKSGGKKNTLYGGPKAPAVTAKTSDYLFFEALAALLSVY